MIQPWPIGVNGRFIRAALPADRRYLLHFSVCTDGTGLVAGRGLPHLMKLMRPEYHLGHDHRETVRTGIDGIDQLIALLTLRSPQGRAYRMKSLVERLAYDPPREALLPGKLQ